MAFGKHTRILTALTVVCLILFMSRSRDTLSSIQKSPSQPSPPLAPFQDAQAPPDEDPLDREDLEEPVADGGDAEIAKSLPPLEVKLVPQAHKLPFADAYTSHFQAVLRLEGLSVQQAKQACAWPAGEYVDFQFDADVEWALKDRPDEEVKQRRQAWHDFVDGGMIPYDLVRNKFSGRGLVILAGNHDTVDRVKVILRQLKRLGSKIAIEFHYWNDEMSEETQRELSDMYWPVSFNDLSKGHNIIRCAKDGLWINYQLKTAALVNSRFAEPLLLDSDNIPVIDPELLFDSDVYREYGTVFWPDIARSRPSNPAWAITNTPCRMNEYEQESGQMLVDKTRYWYHLQLASWMNNEQGPYYNAFLLGDKDMFRFAWHALKTDFGKPRKWLTSVGTSNDGYYCGHSFAQHHPDDGRIAFMHGGLTKSVSPEVVRWNKEERGGFYRSYKKAPMDEDASVNVKVGIKFDGAAYMPNHSADFKWSQCTDMYDVEPRDLEEILPGWEPLFADIGGFWQLEKAGGSAAVGGSETSGPKADGGDSAVQIGVSGGDIRAEPGLAGSGDNLQEA